uniref:Cupin type-1 domain-containing protein n=1 Tax=Compsopogon caeruleus TaxID=31354 RepID=A0A7S1XCL8_9RHOD|mmetsp:Transcript_13251/g.26918  ORF Transcript_13251/g.26918 Transcript_13251/m.26918 type:complete len:200 (+) Transcript_13251:76-675(+)|eukprot:CAMPEP_0184679338 /NCGR_PEP_ID=MMETSP0312-20130426/2181_1 /TAXON_ID=31354 /ORGANISM="Compsopogon coeruleus, Strain SAG 36.94" /LENGTH=199 /DNA_ID=CAMNT_0027128729 /DNA_START=66 /DNA_END=665 /DNA_ORIENTATION=-
MVRSGVLCLVVPLLLFLTANAQLVDPKLPPEAFIINFGNITPAAVGLGGSVTVASMGNTPSLINSGVTFARVRLNPGGANAPHTHPRAVEAFFVIRGKLQVCFAEENGGVTVCNIIRRGEATFFPQGTIHSQQNVGSRTAEFLAVLTSDNPGTLTISSRLFSLPDRVLSAALNITDSQSDSIRNGIPANPVPAGPGSGY